MIQKESVKRGLAKSTDWWHSQTTLEEETGPGFSRIVSQADRLVSPYIGGSWLPNTRAFPANQNVTNDITRKKPEKWPQTTFEEETGPGSSRIVS